MSSFTRYMHVERINSEEINGILEGNVYVFPKIDGSNGSIWLEDGKVCCGSRNHVLTKDWNNGKFYQHATENPKYANYLSEHPNHILYGEWMIPHTIKSYDMKMWNRFYVFDVYDCETGKFIPFSEYESVLKEYDILYLEPMVILSNPTMEGVASYAPKNTFMMTGDSIGEGIVFKNYEYSNPWDRIIWGKVVNADFTAKSRAPNKGERVSLEKDFVEAKVTLESISHEYCKFLEENTFDMKDFPKILGLCWHEFIVDNIFQLIKFAKRQKVDFNALQKEFTSKARICLNEIINNPNVLGEVEEK